MRLAVYTLGMLVVGLSPCEEGVWSGVAQQTNRNEWIPGNEGQEANRKDLFLYPGNVSGRRIWGHSALCEVLV